MYNEFNPKLQPKRIDQEQKAVPILLCGGKRLNQKMNAYRKQG